MEFSAQMMLFARVAEERNFSAAARALGLTPSSVSRQIAQLEDRIGVRLVTRSSQGVTLTVEGGEFYRRCADVAARVAEAEQFAAAIADEPQGALRVLCTVAFGKAQLIPLLPGFLDAYPKVSLSLDITDRPVDMATENVDLAIRFSEQIDDASLVQRRLARNRRVLCAAPTYLAERGKPERLADLAAHNCLRLSTFDKFNDWGLNDPDTGATIAISGRVEANSADSLYAATLAGMGIARLSTYLVNRDIAAGRLVRVLPDYADDSSTLVALYSDRRHLAARSRALLDYLAGHFGAAPPWERDGEP